jgi:lipopolysaccharide transport system permease protein
MLLVSIFSPSRLIDVTRRTTARLFQHRALLFEQLWRDIFEQHAGQMAGGLWLLIHPLFLMAVYVVVFSIVFKARAGGTEEMPLDYTAYILSGVIPWLSAQQAMNKSCAALTTSANLIKQVVFPIEVLPAKAVFASFVPLIVSLVLLTIYVAATHGSLSLTYFLLPFLFAMQLLWWLGMGFLLSSVAVFVRDLKELVQMFSLAGVYFAPIVYLPNWVPPLFKPILYANPFSHLVWCYRDALYFGRIDHPWSWGLVFVFSIVIYVLGVRAFCGLKPYFGDTL